MVATRGWREGKIGDTDQRIQSFPYAGWMNESWHVGEQLDGIDDQ